jgi:EpsI family protein
MIQRVLLMMLVMVATSAVMQKLLQPEPHITRAPLAELSTTLDGWRSTDVPIDAKVLQTLGLTDYINREYVVEQASPVWLYVGFYASQRTGVTIHSPLKCLPGTGWQPIATGRINLNGNLSGGAMGNDAPMFVNRYVVQKGADRQVVLFWYQMRGHVVTSEYAAKLYLIDGAIRTNRTDGALVRVMVPITRESDEATADSTAVAFARRLLPRLLPYLPA